MSAHPAIATATVEGEVGGLQAAERDFVIVTESLGHHRLNLPPRQSVLPSASGNQPPGSASLFPAKARQSFHGIVVASQQCQCSITETPLNMPD